MKKIEFFQTRPLGYSSGSFSIDRTQVAALLAATVFHNPEGKTERDMSDEVEILSASTFSNGCLVTALANQWVIDALGKSLQIKDLRA